MTNHAQASPTKYPLTVIDPIIRPRAAAQQLGVSMATYYRLVKAGKIKHVKISDRTGGALQSNLDKIKAGE